MPQAAADRNLLFGIVALQMDFIDRAALIGAMHAWVLAKDKPLGQVLCERGDLNVESRELLESLVDRHIALHGDSPEQSLATLAPLDSVRKALSGIGDADVEASLPRLPSTVPSIDDAERTRTLVGSPTSTGARFQILRPHAKGGLGEVFVAQDTELRREVALKEIQERHADDADSRARFVQEAEITGGLEHPGVVPVYGLGYYANGRPFYAMRFVRGDSLKEAIGRFHRHGRRDLTLVNSPSATPTAPMPSGNPAAQPQSSSEVTDDAAPSSAERSLEFRKLLGRFIDVCDAIEYAHSRGVLHRDLKPGNIMLGKYGETLVVDWGLAKTLGQGSSDAGLTEGPLRPSGASGSAETVAGVAVGTPAYMSPEQAAGRLDLLGPACDVYSLGATLFSLLTGETPFGKLDIGPTLQKVQRGEFPRPRQIEPRTPLPLEAICLKAMSLRPADRYPSPRALSDDIEHWLADEPVSAYAEPWSVRLRRWVGRHRTSVAGVAAALLVAALASTVAAAFLARANERERQATALARQGQEEATRQRREAEKQGEIARRQEQEAQQQRDRAQANFQLAHDAVDRYFTRVSQDRLLNEASFQPLRRELLATAMEFYQTLVAQQEEGQTVAEFELARACVKLGMITRELESPRKAIELFERGRDIFIRLLEGDPKNSKLQRELAEAYTALSITYQIEQRPTDAERAVQAARALWDELHGERQGKSVLLATQGGLLAVGGQTEPALKVFQEAIELQEELARDMPTDATVQQVLATTRTARGMLLLKAARYAEAERDLTHAQGLWTALVERHPKILVYQQSLAMNLTTLGDYYSQSGRPTEAEDATNRSLEIFRRLASQNPDSGDYQSNLGLVLHNLGRLRLDAGRADVAEANLLEALSIRQRLVEKQATVPVNRSALAVTHTVLGFLHSGIGRPDLALADHEAAIALRERLSAEFPKMTSVQADLALNLQWKGLVLQRLGRLEEAEAALRHGVELRRSLAQGNQSQPDDASNLAISLSALGLVLLGAERYDDAAAAQQEALEIRQRLSSEHPEAIGYQSDVAVNRTNLAYIHQARGQSQQAEAAYQSALVIYQRLAQGRQDNVNLQSSLSTAHGALAQFYQAAGQLAQAEASWKQAIAIQEKLTRDWPAHLPYRVALAASLSQVGLVYESAGRSEDALRATQQSLDLRQQLADGQPAVLEYRLELARTKARLGELNQSIGESADAQAAHERAREIFQRLASDYPAVTDFHSALAAHLLTLARFYAATDELDGAEASLVQARDIADRLVEDQPESLALRRQLAQVHSTLGLLYARAQRLQEGLEAHNLAISLLEKLVAEHPDRSDVASELATALFQLGRQRQQQSEAAPAIESFRRGVEIMERVVERQPAHEGYRRDLGTLARALGLALTLDAQDAAAATVLERAEQVQQEMAKQSPQRVLFEIELAGTRVVSAELARSRGDFARALELSSQAVEGLDDLPAQAKRHEDYASFLGHALAARATAQAYGGKLAQALSDWDRAIELAPEEMTDEYTVRRAVVLAKQGKYSQAIEGAQAKLTAPAAAASLFYDGAGVYAQASAAAARDKQRTATERQDMAERYASRAVELLRQARQKGGLALKAQARFAARDPDLAPLADRADFKALVAALATTAEPEK